MLGSLLGIMGMTTDVSLRRGQWLNGKEYCL